MSHGCYLGVNVESFSSSLITIIRYVLTGVEDHISALYAALSSGRKGNFASMGYQEMPT